MFGSLLMQGASLLTVKGSAFDGSTIYLSKGADLTGNADGKTGSVSFWFRMNGGDGSQLTFLYPGSDDSHLIINRNTSNKIRVQGRNSGGTNILVMVSTTSYTAGATWHHCALSWDLAAATGRMYIDGASDLAGGSTLTNDTIDYTDASHFIGANRLAGEKLNADIAEIMVWRTYIDWSTASTLQKVRSSGGKPVDVGSDGSAVTGTAPIIYQSIRSGGAASDFATNRGSGGNFSFTGTPALSSTSPSD